MVKQVRVDTHKTPKRSLRKLTEQRAQVIEAHYGHCFSVCGYCGWFHHRDYVCSCGVDKGYLEGKDGLVREGGKLVDVYEVPEKKDRK